MTVTMPADSIKPGMQLFLSDSGTNWTLAASKTDSAFRPVITEGSSLESDYLPDLPEYKEDQRGKPVKPSIPVMPKKPYPLPPVMVHRSWWNFLTPGLNRKREQRAQAEHDRRQQVREERYRKRLERYRTELEKLPKVIKEYAVKKAKWDSLKKEEFTAWLNDVYTPAVQRYDAWQKARNAFYDSMLTNWEARQDSLKKQYTQWADTVQTVTQDGLANYVFTTSQVGWINCDRFYDVPIAQQAPVLANAETGSDIRAFLIFTDIRMLLDMERGKDGRFISEPVPTTEPAVVFAFGVKDGRAQLCVESVVEGEVPTLEFKTATVKEVQQQLFALAGK
jgi:hypothetical protein